MAACASLRPGRLSLVSRYRSPESATASGPSQYTRATSFGPLWRRIESSASRTCSQVTYPDTTGVGWSLAYGCIITRLKDGAPQPRPAAAGP